MKYLDFHFPDFDEETRRSLTGNISAVFFDYGGTLFDYYPSNSEVWAKIAKELGVDISSDDPRIRLGLRNQSQEAERLGTPFSELSRHEIHNLNCHVLAAMGIDGQGTQQTIEVAFRTREQMKRYTMYPDAPETLRQITRHHIKIGLISNVPAQLVSSRRASLRENGLLNYFDAIILSVEVGVEKPNKEIFEIALRELGVKNPADAIHVGDSPVVDVIGAQNAGLIPVLFDPLELYTTENVIKIKAVSDILHYLK
jgi:HAD superfamily hydrolase (TIGR01549 family)